MLKVIDCQWHWHNRTYYEALVGRRDYPSTEKAGDGFIYHVNAERAFPIEAFYVDLEPQFEDMVRGGVDVQVSSMGAFNVDALPVDLALDLAMRLNEERAEAEREYPGAFVGLAIVPMQDTEAATSALDHAIGKLGLRGVCICSNIDGEPLDSEHCRPIYARMEELGVPVFIHPTKSIMEPKLRRYGIEYSVGYMVDSSFAALNLIFGGILDEFPKLEIVHPHLGGVLPYLAQRIDFEYHQPWALGYELPKPPSEYLRRFYTDTISRNPGALRLAKDAYGVERVLYASDYPYWSPQEGIDFVRDHLTEDEAEAVLGGNAAALLRL